MELLKQIDIKRRQVLVEAMILEVTVDSNIDTGMEFITSAGGKDGGILAVNNFGGLTNLLSDPTKVSQLSVAAASSGTLNLPNNISIPTQTVLLTAASRNNNVNVLSSPNILATDNEEAEIVVGQNVPFLASTASSDQNLNNTFNQIDRQDVGITLRITPQINSNDYVNLRMFTEVSNVVGDSATSELGPTTTVRTTETTVITKDGQMVIIGGLISDNQTETESGVPYLKDVPVIGTLFKGLGKKSVKTNLLIFITPRVIKDQFDARDITKNKSKKIQDDLFDSGIEPDRTDILNNLEMDTVIESEIYTGKKPSTIRARSKAAEIEIIDTENTGSNSEEIIVPITQKPTAKSAVSNSSNTANNGSSKLNNTNENVNKRPVDPKLPKFEAEFDEELMDLEMAPNLPASKINEPRGTIDTKDYPKNSLGGKFIVLQVEGNSIPSDLPFESSSSGLVAINIPQESNQNAKQFFEVGQKYSFSTAGKPLKFKALGSFSNQKEAEDFYTELKKIKWYNLSPHEIFRLGQDPWKKD
jgi:Flp pilus assembly secretin CpaC